MLLSYFVRGDYGGLLPRQSQSNGKRIYFEISERIGGDVED